MVLLYGYVIFAVFRLNTAQCIDFVWMVMNRFQIGASRQVPVILMK